MAYITSNDYKNVIYSGDARHKVKIWFNNVELQDADRYCEKITRQARILPNDGTKRFTIDNFMSQEIELILHKIDTSIIQGQVEISIGTLVDSENDTYEYVPLGIFNIQDTPKTDKDKVTIKLMDNRVKFDFGYNAEPLIEANGGTATKLQILNDICTQAGVTNNVSSFIGASDEIGIYDSTITATMYVAYIASQAGAIATINRNGELDFIYLNNLSTVKIPLYIVEKYELGTPYTIERVVYEDGIRKYQSSSDDTLSTLYIGSDNPYISNQEQVDAIYNILKNFTIDSCTTGKIMGDPAIDPYDIIEVYGYYEEDEYGNNKFVDDENIIVFRTLANYTMTYTGKIINVYDTQIGKEARTENVSLNGEARFQRYAKSSIDNINKNIDLIVGEQTAQSGRITDLQIDINSIQSLFQITGGTNLIKNSQFLLNDETWEESEFSKINLLYNNKQIKYNDKTVIYRRNYTNSYHTELGKGYNANLIGKTVSIANIVLKNIVIKTKSNNITNLKIGQTYSLHFFYSLDEYTSARFTLIGNNNEKIAYTQTFNNKEQFKEVGISFTATDTNYTLIIETTTRTNGYLSIYDLMLNSGDMKSWEPAMSEVYSTVLKMSQLGLQVYASGSNTITLLTSQGFKIYTSNSGEIGQVVTEFTNTGIKTIDLIANGIIKNGRWVQKELIINSYTHHIEYMESD